MFSIRTWQALLLLVALLARLLYVLCFVGFSAPPAEDGPDYDAIASNLVAGNGYCIFAGEPTSFRPPGYPLFVAAHYAIVGRSLAAVRLSQVVVGALTCLVISFIGARLSGPRVGLLAMGVAAVYPPLIYFSGCFLTEALFLCQSMLLVHVLLAQEEAPTRTKEVLAGVLLALALLTRPAFVFFVPCLFAWGVSRLGLRAGTLVSARILAISVFVIAPWTVRNAVVHGAFVPFATNGGRTFWSANHSAADGGGFVPPSTEEWLRIYSDPPEIRLFPSSVGPLRGLSEVESEARFYRVGGRWIREHPDEALLLAVKKLGRLFTPFMHSTASVAARNGWVHFASYGPVLVLAIVGLVMSLRRPRRFALVYLLMGSVILQAVVFNGSNRHRIGLDPLLIVLAAMAVVGIGRAAPERS